MGKSRARKPASDAPGSMFHGVVPQPLGFRLLAVMCSVSLLTFGTLVIIYELLF
ncbi:MAG TPA: hypothetical protein VGU01_11475 [Sphingomicrobium sp.]|nr:hypothetical protein [Sphingomicrobium sp.]